MEYTVQKLAELAGVSSRALRYYDEIGLLKPSRINSSGYRIYGQDEVNQLQHILFYKELGVDLENIKRIISDPSFDSKSALVDHRDKLLRKRHQLDQMIENVIKTLDAREGKITMTDNQKFEGFKQQMIDENEKKYGKEIREKYGDELVDKSNKKVKKLTNEQFKNVEELGEKIVEELEKAFQTGDPTSKKAQEVADLHRQWLNFYWDSYSKDAHAGLAQLYVDDERFTKFYDHEQPGLAAFLRDAIFVYTGRKVD